MANDLHWHLSNLAKKLPGSLSDKTGFALSSLDLSRNEKKLFWATHSLLSKLDGSNKVVIYKSNAEDTKLYGETVLSFWKDSETNGIVYEEHHQVITDPPNNPGLINWAHKVYLNHELTSILKVQSIMNYKEDSKIPEKVTELTDRGRISEAASAVVTFILKGNPDWETPDWFWNR